MRGFVYLYIHLSLYPCPTISLYLFFFLYLKLYIEIETVVGVEMTVHALVHEKIDHPQTISPKGGRCGQREIEQSSRGFLNH